MLYVNQLVFIEKKTDGSKENEAKRQSCMPENQNSEIKEAKRLCRVGGSLCGFITVSDITKPLRRFACVQLW